jgi:hypothetical protein
MMDVMQTDRSDWIAIASYEILPGRLQPIAAARA